VANGFRHNRKQNYNKVSFSESDEKWVVVLIKQYYYPFIAFYSKCGSLVGQTDFEQKSSADEREAYIGTLSEETAICKQNFIKTEKTVGFQP